MKVTKTIFKREYRRYTIETDNGQLWIELWNNDNAIKGYLKTEGCTEKDTIDALLMLNANPEYRPLKVFITKGEINEVQQRITFMGNRF